MTPRWLARLWAAVTGRSWLSCPLCDQMFGGQEWRDIDGHTACVPDSARRHDGSWRGLAICPQCTRDGRGCRRWGAAGVVRHDCVDAFLGAEARGETVGGQYRWLGQTPEEQPPAEWELDVLLDGGDEQENSP